RLGALLIAHLHRVDFGKMSLQGECGRVFEEWLRAEEDGFREREQMSAELLGCRDPAAAEARHGMRLRHRRHDDSALLEACVIEGRNEDRVAVGQRRIDLVRYDP